MREPLSQTASNQWTHYMHRPGSESSGLCITCVCRYAEAEKTNGRWAMMGVLGIVGAEVHTYTAACMTLVEDTQLG